MIKWLIVIAVAQCIGCIVAVTSFILGLYYSHKARKEESAMKKREAETAQMIQRIETTLDSYTNNTLSLMNRVSKLEEKNDSDAIY